MLRVKVSFQPLSGSAGPETGTAGLVVPAEDPTHTPRKPPRQPTPEEHARAWLERHDGGPVKELPAEPPPTPTYGPCRQHPQAGPNLLDPIEVCLGLLAAESLTRPGG